MMEKRRHEIIIINKARYYICLQFDFLVLLVWKKMIWIHFLHLLALVLRIQLTYNTYYLSLKYEPSAICMEYIITTTTIIMFDKERLCIYSTPERFPPFGTIGYERKGFGFYFVHLLVLIFHNCDSTNS